MNSKRIDMIRTSDKRLASPRSSSSRDDFQVFGLDASRTIRGPIVLFEKVLHVTTQCRLLVLG